MTLITQLWPLVTLVPHHNTKTAYSTQLIIYPMAHFKFATVSFLQLQLTDSKLIQKYSKSQVKNELEIHREKTHFLDVITRVNDVFRK